jgi:hypothetical protein
MQVENTPKAVLVGFDRLQNYLEKQASTFDSIKIANTYNDKTNWRKEFAGAKSPDQIALLIDYLNEWTPEGAPYTWYICLFKGKIQVERFPFSKNSLISVGNISNNNNLTPEFVSQLVDAEKRAAIAEMQLNMMAQNELDPEDEDEDEEPDYVGAIMQQVQPHIPELIQKFLAMLNKQPLQVAGTGLDPQIEHIISELLAKGITIEHLKKLNAMPKAKIITLLAML